MAGVETRCTEEETERDEIEIMEESQSYSLERDLRNEEEFGRDWQSAVSFTAMQDM